MAHCKWFLVQEKKNDTDSLFYASFLNITKREKEERFQSSCLEQWINLTIIINILKISVLDSF